MDNGRRYPPHDRAELRSPLGPPSAAAARFLVERDPYPAEAYIAPDEATAAACARVRAQHQGERHA